MEKFNLACSSKTQEIKKLKSQENQNPKNGEMGDTEPPKNRLRKIKHTRSSILGYRVGLDTVATSYLVGSNEKTHNIPVQILSNCITHHKKYALDVRFFTVYPFVLCAFVVHSFIVLAFVMYSFIDLLMATRC